MYLSKKSVAKIFAAVMIYVILTLLCFVLTVFEFVFSGSLSTTLVVCTLLLAIMTFAMYKLGRFSEGSARHVRKGNKLILTDLKPGEFIDYYEALKADPTLVEAHDGENILRLAAMAYNAVGDEEKCLWAADKIMAVSSSSKKSIAKLIKASYLYDYDRVDEAESLIGEVASTKMNAYCKMFYDVLINTDRAMARGDYKLCEAYWLRYLENKRVHNFGRVLAHFSLAEIYEKTDRPDKALEAYRYCAEHGGETDVKKKALEAMERLS